MFYQAVEGGFLLRVESGEDLIAALKVLMEEEEIGSGFVTGLGAVTFARLGYFDMSEREYVDEPFAGVREICSLTGTLSWHEGAPFPHVHLILTDLEFRAIGGHCFEATAGATIEVFAQCFSERVERRADESIGLHLLSLDQHRRVS